MLTVGQLRKRLRRKERIKAICSLLLSFGLYGLAFKGLLFAWHNFKGETVWWGFLFYGMLFVILGYGFADDVIRDVKRLRKPDIRRSI